jgi:hypothetical protein
MMEVTPALVLVISTLDALEIPYFVSGSVASSVHGLPRLTRDADIVAPIGKADVDRLVAALQDTCYISEDAIQDAIQHHSAFNVIHLETMLKVDIFVPPDDPWSQGQFARRALQPLPESEDAVVYVGSPEDIVLQKLRWYEMTGRRSDRQWSDVAGVLKVQAGKLDMEYMRHWAKELGVETLLQQAMEESGQE